VAQNDEITKIEGLVLQHTVPARIVVCGQGGVGKTQIALELAYRIRKHDPKYSIFWISSFSDRDIGKSYSNIAKILGFYDVEPGEAEALVRNYLSQERAGKYLLIFDDAEDLSQLKEYLPQNEEAQILVTTRNKKSASTIASTNVIMLDPPTSNIDFDAALERWKTL
jgi:CO dehydrogenase nickel-insertion accessory protein CooC1